jgi:EmrB/QacA subfamily drug resistance transporter
MSTATLSAAVSPRSAQAHASTFSNKKRKIAVLVVALAFIMDLVDITIVNIAIPSIQTALHASYASIQWLVAGYALTFALLLITGGRMGDVFGYKKLFLIGVSGFMFASLLSGVAWNPEVLVAGRLFQGAMAALMVPQVLSVVQLLYKPEERLAINNMFGGISALATTLGAVFGGLLIKANIAGLDWRVIFLINVPISLLALILGGKYLPNGKSAHPLKLDLVGTGSIVAALGLLIFPLIQGRELGWPVWTFAMMAASAPVLGLFTWWQRRKARTDGSPLIMPTLFKHRSFSAGLATSLLTSATMACFALTFTLMLQLGLGFSPVHTALTGLFIPVGFMATMGLLGKSVIPKLGRWSPTIGATIMGLGIWAVSLIANNVGDSLSTWQLAPALLVMGIGMGMMFGTLMAFTLSNVDTREAGSASGALNAVQQVGGAIGIALIGAVFFGQLALSTNPTAANFAAAFRQGAWLELGLLALCIGLTFFLPRRIAPNAYQPPSM